MTIAICGAGSVGLVLGARLARAGEDVLFLTRRAEQAAMLRDEGVRLEDPARGDAFEARVRAETLGDADADTLAGSPVLLCTRTGPLADAATVLARLAPQARVVGAQNGVDSDAALAAFFERVLGLVVRQTCTRVSDRCARALPGGRLIVGDHPEGAGRAARDLASRLRAAGYDVGLAQRLADDRWLKLCVNLMSAPNALVRRQDHRGQAFVEAKARLLEEARDALARAGIRAASCDGRDRTLEAEIEQQRGALSRGTSARDLPLYNQVWMALRRGGPLEADQYHRRIVALAAAHGVPAPVNQRVLALLLRVHEQRLGPESLPATDLLPA